MLAVANELIHRTPVVTAEKSSFYFISFVFYKSIVIKIIF